MNELNMVSGRLVDPIRRKIYDAKIHIRNGIIERIEEEPAVSDVYILPGFVDSHVHIESSMLVPSRFSEVALRHGTVAVVPDPHEVANVAGIDGVKFMIENAKNSPLKFFFGAPSCVPASPVDECFQPFTPERVGELLDLPDIYFLAEMMNFPGVIGNNPLVHSILQQAHIRNKPIDGHAPGLAGDGLVRYVSAGITTDHECFTLDEAISKIKLGMKVLIREGSAARNFNALHSLLRLYPEMVMFCTDDCHPDELVEGHINRHVRKALSLGYNLFDVIQAASVNPVNHYKLNVGLLQPGQPADFIVVDNLSDLNILSTFINGIDVTGGKPKPVQRTNAPLYQFPNSFNTDKIDFHFPTDKYVKVIKAIDGELITDVVNSKVPSLGYDLNNDILKIVVLSRYNPANIGVGLIKGFGFKKGAIAASIAHDSHHIVAIGTNDESIVSVIQYILSNRGGICYSDGDKVSGLPLPFFGLMSDIDANVMAKEYSSINERIKADGCTLRAPFMTMSFMSLTVIPHLKLTPQGLFDVDSFSLTPIVSD